MKYILSIVRNGKSAEIRKCAVYSIRMKKAGWLIELTQKCFRFWHFTDLIIFAYMYTQISW